MKYLLDYGPLVVFFVAYKFFGLIAATGALVAATAVSVVGFYLLQKRVPVMPLVSALVVGIFGGLTITLHDEIFIKLKPTIVNILFAVTLLGGAYIFKKGLLKYLFGEALPLPEEAWLTFSKRWGLFFLFLAVVNEVVWRHFPTDFWVKFKVFGMLSMSILFTLSQWPFLKRYISVEKSEKTVD